jgi:hypothetical protein
MKNIYHRDEISHVDWPATPDGDYARRYLLPFIINGSQNYIANVQTELLVLQVDDLILPVTQTTSNPANSWVCSPDSHYLRYGHDELARLPHACLRVASQILLKPIVYHLRSLKLDQVILVNNWLLSTNLYPTINPQQIATVLAYLAEIFPDRPIVFRSVDAYQNPTLFRALSQAGCEAVFSRQIYYQNPQDEQVQRRKQFKIDLKRFQRMPHQVIDGRQINELATRLRIVELYNALYLQKYSYLNPQFTEEFVKLALDNDLLTIKLLCNDGRIDGVIGYFVRNGVMTCPLFGYDTQLPKKSNLYVLLTMLASLEIPKILEMLKQEGVDQKLRLNLSAGVGQFKQLRGGIPVLEFNMVYQQHLPVSRQRAWRRLKFLLNYVAIPMIQHFKL